MEYLQCHRVGTMTSQKPRCQAGKAHKTTCMPACSYRSRYSIDICGCPQASPETDGLTTRVLEIFILTGALRRGSSGGMKLWVGPEKGLGRIDSLLELPCTMATETVRFCGTLGVAALSLLVLSRLKAVSY